MSRPNCFLLSSHDDFSVVSMLPPDVAVISQIRDPLDRFLSAYEFAIEVASRSVKRPRHYRKKAGRIATEDVWPWSYLVPFFIEDIRPRVVQAQAERQPPGGRWVEIEQNGKLVFFNAVLNETREALTEAEMAQGGGTRTLLDPYNNSMVMSLKEFAQHPIAMELLHNGAAFQVLGITNYSHWGDASAFRSCLLKYGTLRDQMVEVAQARVRRFSHVGTTDRLFDSAASALVSMGLSTTSPAYTGGDDDVAGGRKSADNARRRAVEADDDDDQQQQQQQQHQQQRVQRSEVAAQLQLLAKLIREARRRLQAAQRELVEAQRADADAATVDALRNKVDTARNELIEAQEKLAAVRDQLPEGLGGRGLSGQLGLAGEDHGDAATAAHRRLLAEDLGQGQAQEQVEEVVRDVDPAEIAAEAKADSHDEATATETGTEAVQAQGQAQSEESGMKEEGRAGEKQAAVSAAGSASQGIADAVKLDDDVSEQRRRLANKIALARTDAFGNPLDPEFRRIRNTDVGSEFVRCASRAQQRSSSRRDQSLAVLTAADGRRVMFSKAARKRIPQDVLDYIRSVNTMDTAIHKLALSLLDARIAEQKAEGLFEELPLDAAEVKPRKRRVDRQGEQEKTSGGDEL